VYPLVCGPEVLAQIDTFVLKETCIKDTEEADDSEDAPCKVPFVAVLVTNA